MDQSKHYQKKKSFTSDDHHNHKFMNSQFMKRVITKLVLSVSVFSLFFSHQQTWFSLLNNLNFYLSTLPVKLVSHTLDKNYIFLLCNGLLVFLTKYSGLFSSSSSSSSSFSSSSSSKHVNNNTLNEYTNYRSFKDDSRMMEAAELPLLKKEDHDRDEAQQNDQHEHIEEKVIIVAETSTTDHHQYHENSFMVEEDKLPEEEEEQQEEEEEEKQVFVEEEEQGGLYRVDIDDEEEEEEEERGGNGELSTEELNKKFDDFIRKMKEELRIEAQRQLVMV